MTFTVTTESAAASGATGAAIGALLGPGDLVLLVGGLGAGKTTMAKGIARGLGVTDPVTSPTFAIVQAYEGRVPVAHVDVYRLSSPAELVDLGLDELLDDHVVLVEWGDTVAAALPADRIEVRLEAGVGADERIVTVTASGASWEERAPALARALGSGA